MLDLGARAAAPAAGEGGAGPSGALDPMLRKSKSDGGPRRKRLHWRGIDEARLKRANSIWGGALLDDIDGSESAAAATAAAARDADARDADARDADEAARRHQRSDSAAAEFELEFAIDQAEFDQVRFGSVRLYMVIVASVRFGHRGRLPST